MTLPDPPPATLRLRVDCDAMAHNWRALNRLSGPAVAGAAVKANAYGTGVALAVPTLSMAGARHFFVAHWGEVAAVLRHVPAEQIAVLHGVNTSAEAGYAMAAGVRPVLNSARQIGLWREAGGGPCHVMIDTGINRLGCPVADAVGLTSGLVIEVLMSHLASADEDSAQNAAQCAIFASVAAAIPAQVYSLANSAGIALGSDYHFDLTRPGLALYGGVARAELGNVIKQVVYPEAAVLQLRDLSAGDLVGYNAVFKAQAPMRAGTVSIGYADGFLRSWGTRGALQHGAVRLPILGRVSMDMVVVDCTAAPELREGDFLGIPYHLPDAARASGLSQYELLTLLGNRFSR